MSRLAFRSQVALLLVSALVISSIGVAIAASTVTPPPTFAFVATAGNFPDALAVGPVAGRLNAPLFITGHDSLDDYAKAGLQAFDPQVVVIAGGTAAVSQAVEDQIKALLPAATVRRAGGTSRTETAKLVADIIKEFNPAFLPTAASAADSDLLDGLDSTDLARADHHHDARYYTKGEVDEDVAALADDAWAYVISNGGLHATSGNVTVTKPATGEYCVVVPKRGTHKAAQVTLADPAGTKIVSVGTGHGSACNPLFTATHDAVPVYVKTTGGTATDGNFTIFVPAP